MNNQDLYILELNRKIISAICTVIHHEPEATTDLMIIRAIMLAANSIVETMQEMEKEGKN